MIGGERPRHGNHTVLEVWLPLLLCIALAGAWYHAMRLREHATLHARALCERHGLQLLDDTVALHRLHARWSRRRLQLTREYRFDTSRGGDHRQTATMTLRGEHVVRSSLPAVEPPGNVVPVATAPFLRASLAPPLDPPTQGGNVIPLERARRTLH